jgi:hypothetical protein
LASAVEAGATLQPSVEDAGIPPYDLSGWKGFDGAVAVREQIPTIPAEWEARAIPTLKLLLSLLDSRRGCAGRDRTRAASSQRRR